MGLTSTPLAKHAARNIFSKIRAEKFEMKKEKNQITVVMRSNINDCIKQILVNAYTCSVRLDKNLVRFFKITAGPEKSSVLFFSESTRKTNKVYKLQLMIENLHPKFLLYYL